jgi:hypothetical protein
VWQCLAVHTAVCGSTLGSVWKCARQSLCQAVRQCDSLLQCCSVQQCGSVRQYSSVRMCGRTRLCGSAVVCGSTTVCGSAHGSMRQCVAVFGNEWQCVAVRAALCNGSGLYVYIYTKLLTIYILYCCIPFIKIKQQIHQRPFGQPYEHRVHVIKINLNEIKRNKNKQK